MWIQDSARKWGITDRQIRHALRFAVRAIPGSNEAILFIGADQQAGFSKSGSWTLIPGMRGSFTPWTYAPLLQVPLRTVIKMATEDFDFETFEPARSVQVDNTEDLKAIADASVAVASADARLREVVLIARSHGRSWNRIALALGVSRQAARQKYAELVNG